MSEMSFPKHWYIKTLGKFCRVFSGFAFKTSDYTKDGIPLIKIGNLQDGTVIISSDNDYVPDSWRRREELQRFTLKSGDILIALTGKTGKTAVVPPNLEDALLNQRVGKIELISSEVEHGFILAVTKTNFFQEAIQQNTFRSVQGNISPSSISQIAIPLPPLPEQRAIASVLGAIQEAKFACQKEIALERERKAALMDVLFSHGTKGEPRKQTEIGEIPESWELVRLGDYCHKPDYGYTESANDSPVGPQFLRITDIQNDEVNWIKVPHCICSEEDKKKYSLKTGDIVIARIGATTGKAYMVEDCLDAVFASYLIRVRTKDGLVPNFLAQYFRTNGYWKQINQSKGGRLKGGVNIPILCRLRLPLPRLSEQQEIAETLQACDDKIVAVEQETIRLDELFHAMLEDLMTGERSAVPLIHVDVPD